MCLQWESTPNEDKPLRESGKYMFAQVPNEKLSSTWQYPENKDAW